MNNEKLSLFRKFNLAKRCKVIKLVDVFLIIILLILIVQSVFSLFFNVSTENHTFLNIDSILRTSFSSIFGYILSANFLSNGRIHNNATETDTPKITEVPSINPTSNVITNQIGFSTGKSELANKPKTTSCSCQCEFDSRDLQIFLIGCFAIFSLVILIIARNLGEDFSLSETELSQMRSILSASTGFLLGYPTNNAKK